jgi:hypothetical protein
VLLTTPAWAQMPFIYSCAEDSHIDEAKKKALNSVGTNFVQTLLGPDPSLGFLALSKEWQQANTRAQFKTRALLIQRLYKPTDLRTQHVYLINAKGNSEGQIVCATDLTKPDGWELRIPGKVNVVPGSR